MTREDTARQRARITTAASSTRSTRSPRRCGNAAARSRHALNASRTGRYEANLAVQCALLPLPVRTPVPDEFADDSVPLIRDMPVIWTYRSLAFGVLA
jgi:hypothetical protein